MGQLIHIHIPCPKEACVSLSPKESVLQISTVSGAKLNASTLCWRQTGTVPAATLCWLCGRLL